LDANFKRTLLDRLASFVITNVAQTCDLGLSLGFERPFVEALGQEARLFKSLAKDKAPFLKLDVWPPL
jgi:hypothetical protein